MQGRQNHGQTSGSATAQGKARHLLDGLIAYRAELGELGRELEDILRAAGVTPSSRAPEYPSDGTSSSDDPAP